MYEIKILTNACTALIKLADKYAEDTSARSNIYHLLRFARTSIKEYPQKDVSLDKLLDRLYTCSERLEKLAGENLFESITVLDCGIETKEISQPIANAHGSIVRLIRNAMEEKNVEDFSQIHAIAVLYMHRLLEYSNSVDTNSDAVHKALFKLAMEISRSVGQLETAMKSEKIDYDEIVI
ncbi:MAG: hypothetical protein NC253_01110 [Ruminococcus sp.]|nr:hypothetical protein [Ruminococcus sp.]MCM1382765.1 hypothetical protein [Muribaculaceae bacterium]